jgi:hypothetical protein
MVGAFRKDPKYPYPKSITLNPPPIFTTPATVTFRLIFVIIQSVFLGISFGTGTGKVI